MERLVKKVDDKLDAVPIWFNIDSMLDLDNTTYRGLFDIINKLAYFEDLQEQGRLVESPVQIGDTMYYWIKDPNEKIPQPRVGEFKVRGIQIMPDGIYVFDGDSWDKIGTQYAYLTRAEAEQALKEAQK